MRGRKVWIARAICIAATTAAASANAQSSANQAAAEALFKQGRELMTAGQFAQACPKLAESERLDPAPGTLLNLATCYESNGQIASAWVTYKEAATAAQNADQQERAQLARRKAGELEAKLPTLTVVVPPGADRSDLQITRDREVLGRPGWGVPIPADPGVHTVEASAPGRRTWQGQASVEGAGSAASIEVPPLEAEAPAEPAPIAAAATGVAPPGASPGSESAPPVTTGSGSGQRAAGWVLGGVGVAGLLVGTLFGAIAKSDNDDAKGQCLTNTACSAQGVASGTSALHAATASTIAFVAGGVLAAAGVIVYLTAPSSGARPRAGVGLSPMVASGSAGVALRGGW
jgi:hypothetical protein